MDGEIFKSSQFNTDEEISEDVVDIEQKKADEKKQRLERRCQELIFKRNHYGPRICLDTMYMDMHIDYPPLLEFEYLRCSLLACEFKANMDRRDFCSTVSRCLDRLQAFFKCVRKNCSSNASARYFCRCGLVHVCANCLSQRSSDDEWKCTECQYAIPQPYVNLYRDDCYTELERVVLHMLPRIERGLSEWAEYSTPSATFSVYMDLVEQDVHVLRKHLICRHCGTMMDSECHFIMRSYCYCGFLICHHCTMKKSMQSMIVQRNLRTPPPCSLVLSHDDIVCETCGHPTGNIGTCLALSGISLVMRMLLRSSNIESTNRSETLRKMFVASMRTLGFKYTNDTPSAYVPKEEDDEPDISKSSYVDMEDSVVHEDLNSQSTNDDLLFGESEITRSCHVEEAHDHSINKSAPELNDSVNNNHKRISSIVTRSISKRVRVED